MPFGLVVVVPVVSVPDFVVSLVLLFFVFFLLLAFLSALPVVEPLSVEEPL